jgi:hypothetical protein
MQCRQSVAEFQVSVAQSERALQVKKDNAFDFPLFDVQAHQYRPAVRSLCPFPVRESSRMEPESAQLGPQSHGLQYPDHHDNYNYDVQNGLDAGGHGDIAINQP